MAQPEARPAAAAAPGLSTTAPPRLPWEGRPGCWVSTSRSKEGVVSTRGWFPAVCPCDAHRLWQQLSWAAFLSVWEALGGPFVWGADAGFPGGSVVDATWGSFSLDLTSVGDMAGGGGPCCVKKGSGPVRPALSEPVVGGGRCGKRSCEPRAEVDRAEVRTQDGGDSHVPDITRGTGVRGLEPKEPSDPRGASRAARSESQPGRALPVPRVAVVPQGTSVIRLCMCVYVCVHMCAWQVTLHKPRVIPCASLKGNLPSSLWLPSVSLLFCRLTSLCFQRDRRIMS